MRRTALVRTAALGAALTVCAAAQWLPSSATDSKGSEFWLAFPGNIQANYPGHLKLFVTSDQAASGTVTIADPAFTKDFTTSPGAVTEVELPLSAEQFDEGVVSSKSVHVTADQQVTVYALSLKPATSDAYLGLPVDALGTDYVVTSYPSAFSFFGSQFVVTGTADGTTVTITPSQDVPGHPAGQAFTVPLAEGESYLVGRTASGADLTGTTVSADKPVAVFAGNQCTQVPNGYYACDTVLEQLTPTTSWGSDFLTVPLATRVSDAFRVVSATDGTEVSINGEKVATLDRGQVFEKQVTGGAHVTATAPVYLAQFSDSSSYDGTLSDPFMMMTVPTEQWLDHYTVATPGDQFERNYINVAAPTDSLNDLQLDAKAVNPAAFTQVPGTGFSVAALEVAQGTHNLSGSADFSVGVYGFNNYDSYGYAGGMNILDLVNCPTNGYAGFDGTPLEGAPSQVLEDSVVPALEGVDPAAGAVGHQGACGAAQAESAAEQLGG